MANTANKLSKYQGKLDLGEVKLSVNQGIMGELDGLLAKLNEIKSTAKNMGSIKLTVGDNIKTKDGKIVVGETTSSSNTARSAGITLRQAQAEIKRNMKTIGTLQEQYVSGIIDESTYKQSKRTIGHRNSQLARQIQNQGTASDWVTSASDIRGAQAKNQEAYKAMTQSASEYDKVITNLSEKQKTFNKMAQVYNPNNGKPLDKTLGQGYDERLKSFNDTYEQLKNLVIVLRLLLEMKETLRKYVLLLFALKPIVKLGISVILISFSHVLQIDIAVQNILVQI